MRIIRKWLWLKLNLLVSASLSHVAAKRRSHMDGSNESKDQSFVLPAPPSVFHRMTWRGSRGSCQVRGQIDSSAWLLGEQWCFPSFTNVPWKPEGGCQGQIGLNRFKMKFFLSLTLAIVQLWFNLKPAQFVDRSPQTHSLLPHVTTLQMSSLQWCENTPPSNLNIKSTCFHVTNSQISKSHCKFLYFKTFSNIKGALGCWRWVGERCITVTPPAVEIKKKYSDTPPVQSQPPFFWPRLFLCSLFSSLSHFVCSAVGDN